MLQVEKRNGVLMPFDKQRIIDAINKAFLEVDGKIDEDSGIPEKIAEKIKQKAEKKSKPMKIEEIQNLAEDYLMASRRKDVARSYVRYRYKRDVARKGQDDFMRELSRKIHGLDIENQNANIDEMSFGGRVGAASDLLMKKFALDYCVSRKSRENHLNNEIYIHDLASYPIGCHNCLSLPFDDLLANGFNTRQTDVRPANSVSTAFQLIAVLFQLQSLQQFG